MSTNGPADHVVAKVRQAMEANEAITFGEANEEEFGVLNRARKHRVNIFADVHSQGPGASTDLALVLGG